MPDSKLKLLITEATDEHIKIAGAISDTGWIMREPAKNTQPVELALDKAASQLPAAVVYAIRGGTLAEGNKLMFKHPITIKAASKKPVVVLDDYGLSEAIRQASEGKLTKSAQNSFCDELIDAIADAKIDASETGMELSMPLKLEFRDEATKNAFMNLGRKKKLKKIAARIKQFSRKQLLDRMAQKLAMCGAKHNPGKHGKKRKKAMSVKKADGPPGEAKDKRTPKQEQEYRGAVSRTSAKRKGGVPAQSVRAPRVQASEKQIKAKTGPHTRLADILRAARVPYRRPPAFHDVPGYLGLPSTGGIIGPE